MADFPITTKMSNSAEEIMSRGMELANLFVSKNYLIDIDSCEPVPLAENQKSMTPLSLFQIDKIVYDQNENMNEKLVSVYSALSNFGSSVILVISSDEKGIGFYLGTRDETRPDVAKAILEKSLKGNFPGISVKEKKADQIEDFLNEKIPERYSRMAVTSVSIVPGMRDENDKNSFVQGIEKFIDSMAGEKYTAIFISSPLSKQEIEDKKRGYEEMYSALSQCSQVVMTYGENESDSVADSISDSFSKSVNDGISDTTGKNKGTFSSKARTHDHGLGFGRKIDLNFGGGKTKTKGKIEGTTQSRTDSHFESQTTGNTRTDTKTNTKGTSSSVQLTRHNKSVEVLLEKIDEQLERIKSCESFGLWDSACYFIADTEEVAIVAANTYKALVSGKQSNVENSFINLWDSEYEHYDKSLKIMDYLRYGIHPVFRYEVPFKGSEYDSQDITAASLISGRELPILMGLPHRSVSGVTSVVSAEFGRNVFRKSGNEPESVIDLGAVYHMGEVFSGNRVEIDLESMASHCLITGASGAGKTNAAFKLIEEITKPTNNIKFLVIEPTKGEYKLRLGKMKNVNIFTTNPKYYSMLCINPFEFNEEIHILEHLDRLVEVFSASWPLDAAIPVVLKNSFERAYIRHGWDMVHSSYQDLGNRKFPVFRDVADELQQILKESDFSTEVKGSFAASLIPRVESLIYGLNGQIFSGVPVSDATLFNENTVVDLSRIGSAETKALIMGILVLRLEEFRQVSSRGINLPLKHITFLEEAHYLLKKTSAVQGLTDTQGRSIEMLSNAIAEMHTYGEGFVILDQSPTSIDISAIKYTNTKIVMRLPEASDCEAAGRSIGLNSEQIAELSRMDKGVAVVFQNDWLEPVLTKIDESSNTFRVSLLKVNSLKAESEMLYYLVEELINESQDKKYNISWLKDVIEENSKDVCSSSIQRAVNLVTNFCEEWRNGTEGIGLPGLIFNLLNCQDLMKRFEDELPAGIKKLSLLDEDITEHALRWADSVYKGLDQYMNFLDKFIKDQVFLNIILYQIADSKKSEQYKVVLYCVKNKEKVIKR